MKIKRILLIAVLVLFAAAAVFAASADTVVFITANGTKYHVGNCSSLSKSKIETTLGNAVSRGFAPCTKCKPPALDK